MAQTGTGAPQATPSAPQPPVEGPGALKRPAPQPLEPNVRVPRPEAEEGETEAEGGPSGDGCPYRPNRLELIV